MIPPVLLTPRLELRGHRPEDLPALAAMWSDEDVVRHTSGVPSGRAESWGRLLRYRGLWAVLGYGYWAMTLRETGEFAGDVGFADFRREMTPPIEGIPEAGWALRSDLAGQGLATEAVAAILQWSERAGLARTFCIIDPGNAPSLRVAEKAGYAMTNEVLIKGRASLLGWRDAAS